MRNIFDILLVSVLFYQIISMLKGTRAAQILIGLAFIFIAYLFSNFLQLETLHWIISKFYSSFIIVIIVLFQDDIRRILTKFGKGHFLNSIEMQSGTMIINEVCNAVKNLSHDRIGALIVFERGISLNKLHDHSVPIEALISEQLLISIFQSFSPLHDGAVIVRKNRITCASAQLPLSKNPRFSRRLGTRHSAAVGISEETDAVVLVVSEETGNISIAWEGNLQKQSSIESAKKMLTLLLIPKNTQFSFSKWLKESITQREKSHSQLHFKNTKTKETNHKKHKINILNFFRKKNIVSENHNEKAKKIVHENDVATNSIFLEQNTSLEFPSFKKMGNVQIPEHLLILSNKEKSFTTDSLKDKEVHLDDHHEQNDDDLFQGDELHSGKNNRPIAIEKNEAAKALSELKPAERFVPPMPSPPPPRDVSIGGVSLNPPLDKANNNNKAATNDENAVAMNPLSPKES
ncbi:MAG: diadenylate cyclase CdaA [Silvanigrellaceae bacterium]|nr:diadenylate cyclase CdaA [Silvanigrellaceae bacterium]